MTAARHETAGDPDKAAYCERAGDPVTGAASGGQAGGPEGQDAAQETAGRVWRNLRALVLERNERRKEVAEAIGMSFFRVKALRRIAARPSQMSELAAELACDRPYLTLVVDDLQKRGLVERRQHPTDRRCKIVSATAEGLAVADRANAILGNPPPALLALPAADLAALERITSALAGPPRD
ncbi:MarR family winged helix-turn-helix transcriptional regulator [Streptomyces sp. NBC_01198]|uniref:MarR family winged helix-turn-helix transcriptional regulator n=1 Tax=Streptomyces sp. NBC_01198 TaxID=2903769 RepID=UPI002E0D81B9|nr:MarR family transcriptional regulator [Streptomyces sp. NBC_01198]